MDHARLEFVEEHRAITSLERVPNGWIVHQGFILHFGRSLREAIDIVAEHSNPPCIPARARRVRVSGRH
jgi:hypothetical protein